MWVAVEDGRDLVSSRILILFIIIIIIIIIIVKFRIYILFLFNLYNTLVQIKKRNLIYTYKIIIISAVVAWNYSIFNYRYNY
jgi:hypothetical protein